MFQTVFCGLYKQLCCLYTIGHPVSTQTVLEETFLPSQPSFHFMLWGAVMDMFLFGQILTQIASLSTLCCEQNRTISGHTDILAWRGTSSGRECRTEGRWQKPKKNTLVRGWETPFLCFMFVRCLCAYALMPVANECHCCRELEELNQKCNNSGLTYYVIILTSKWGKENFKTFSLLFGYW